MLPTPSVTVVLLDHFSLFPFLLAGPSQPGGEAEALRGGAGEQHQAEAGPSQAGQGEAGGAADGEAGRAHPPRRDGATEQGEAAAGRGWAADQRVGLASQPALTQLLSLSCVSSLLQYFNDF